MKIVKVGTHRGNSRLWLEGKWLAAAGFTQGTRYRAVFGETRVMLVRDDAGPRLVSGKKGGIAIIDINAKELTAVLPAGQAEVVVREDGWLLVTGLALAQHMAADPHCSCSTCIAAMQDAAV